MKSWCRLSGFCAFALKGCRGALNAHKPRPGFARREETGRLQTGCRSGNRTRDLRGMNPVSYRCSILLITARNIGNL